MQPGKSKSYTLGEAEAYDKGYEDGVLSATFRTATVKKGSEACINDNPNSRCDKCDCWKSFREYCS